MSIVADSTTAATSTATKRQLVEQAFSEVALNGWEFDITADEKETALTRLDALMYELSGRGVSVAYAFPTQLGGGDLDDMLGCPDTVFFALAILLAKRLCPTMGKTFSAESRVALREAERTLFVVGMTVPTVTYAPGTPIGSGNKPWANRYPFVPIVTA